MRESWGRFTARGSAEVEDRIAALLEEVARKCRNTFVSSNCRALILLGGYGRGEGGVEVVDGRERPHNNLDFLAITNDLSPGDREKLKGQLQDALIPVSQKSDIAIDIGMTTVSKLGNSPSLVMWYDMRYGHKTILGDAKFVPSLAQFEVDRIPPWDVRNLLVNRGTLLLINEQLIASGKGALEESVRKLIVKHIMKAIIGYGDALLFFLGDYNWSYAEKQRRMRARTDVAPEFRKLYDEAVEFRFQPQYPAYLTRDPSEWMALLREAFAPLHLICESKRLGAAGLTWEKYPELAFRHALFEDTLTPRAWLKRAYHGVFSSPCPVRMPLMARVGYRALGGQGLFPILFPVVAYRLEAPSLRELVAGACGARNTEHDELRRAYLHLWGRVCDTNFASFLQRWNVSLEPQA